MERRTVLAGGLAIAVPLAGCLDSADGERDGETDDSSGLESRVRECESQYIREEVVARDDETIDDPLQPAVVEAEPRDDGEFVEVRTEFGVVRETDDGPDEHVDRLVTAYYLVSGETVYRTGGAEAEGDPRDGIAVDC